MDARLRRYLLERAARRRGCSTTDSLPAWLARMEAKHDAEKAGMNCAKAAQLALDGATAPMTSGDLPAKGG